MKTPNAVEASNSRQLPAELSRAAQRAGYQILAAFDRLGLTHTNQDGTVFAVRFADAALYSGRWAVFEVDGARLWHVAASDLAKERVVSTLELATHLPVKLLQRDIDGRRGLFFVCDLLPNTPKPAAARLPARVLLDLGQRPGDDPLLVPVGVGRDGPVWRGLAQLGHTLIMGASGSGKSTFLHCALASLFTATGPDTLQVALIDPKQLELATWASAPHLRGPIAWNVAGATQALGALADEMDRRGDLMAGSGARDLRGYNKHAGDPLPWLLGVIDEALDLTLQAGDRSELVTLLKRIASKGRATGVYLWLAATHGTADILPRVVTLNLATRIVFRVQDAAAAHVAGCPGAQNIPRDKPGRMLARLDGEPVELQGYYLTDGDLQKMANALGDKPACPALTDSERALVVYAIEHLGGAFIIGKLAAAFGGAGWTNHKLRVLAAAWERRGLLTPPKHATDSRHVTQDLCDLCGDCTG